MTALLAVTGTGGVILLVGAGLAGLSFDGRSGAFARVR